MIPWPPLRRDAQEEDSQLHGTQLEAPPRCLPREVAVARPTLDWPLSPTCMELRGTLVFWSTSPPKTFCSPRAFPPSGDSALPPLPPGLPPAPLLHRDPGEGPATQPSTARSRPAQLATRGALLPSIPSPLPQPCPRHCPGLLLVSQSPAQSLLLARSPSRPPSSESWPPQQPLKNPIISSPHRRRFPPVLRSREMWCF